MFTFAAHPLGFVLSNIRDQVKTETRDRNILVAYFGRSGLKSKFMTRSEKPCPEFLRLCGHLPRRITDKIAITVEGCWLYSGTLRRGYGRVCWNGRTWSLHRLTYELMKRRIPDYKDKLMHSCDIRNCCYPGHLKPGTNSDNQQDRRKKERRARRNK